MKCLFKVLGTIVLLPVFFVVLLPAATISIILMGSGCVDEEDTPISWVMDGLDAWRQL